VFVGVGPAFTVDPTDRLTRHFEIPSTTRSDPSFVILNFLQLATTWQTYKIMRWERHLRPTTFTEGPERQNTTDDLFTCYCQARMQLHSTWEGNLYSESQQHSVTVRQCSDSSTCADAARNNSDEPALSYAHSGMITAFLNLLHVLWFPLIMYSARLNW